MIYKYTKLQTLNMEHIDIVKAVKNGEVFTKGGSKVHAGSDSEGIFFFAVDWDRVLISGMFTREPEIDYKAKFEELEPKYKAVCAELEELQKVHDEIKEALS